MIGLSWHFTGENFKKWMLGELSRVISLCGIDSCSKQELIKGLLFIFTQGSSFSCYSFCIKVIFYCSKFYLVVSCESQSSCRAACGQWTGIYRELSSLTDQSALEYKRDLYTYSPFFCTFKALYPSLIHGQVWITNISSLRCRTSGQWEKTHAGTRSTSFITGRN